MSKQDLYETTIQFKVFDKIDHKFKIIHNIPSGIELIVESWLLRAKVFTPQNLCEYVKNKDSCVIIMTEKEYKKLKTK